MARITIIGADGQQDRELLPHNTLGRHPNNTHQVLDRIVSKEHCHIDAVDGGYVLHDLGSLQLVRHTRAPLTVVVINNQGGRIFEQLPLAQSPAVGPNGDGAGLMARFTTPHTHALAEIARAIGWSAVRVEDEVALRQALRRSPDRGLLIEVMVPPHSSLELLGAYHRGLAGALAARAGACP